MIIRIQGVELTPQQAELLRDIVSEAVRDTTDLPSHDDVVALHKLLIPVPRPFDPRPEGHRVGERMAAVSVMPDRLDEKWAAYDRARRG
jgi:hypothetical protein